MSKTFLVTGANGFVGSHIIDNLQQNQHKIYCLVRKTSNLEWLNDKDVQLIYGSLNELNEIEKIKNEIDIVIHCAGVVQSKKKDLFTEVNIEGTKNLLNSFNNCKICKFIYISSLTAAGPSNEAKPYKEGMESKPLTSYGKSKLQAEKLVQDSELPYIILRPGAIFGERDKAMFSVFKMASKGIFAEVGKNKKYVSMIDGKQFADIVELVSSSNVVNTNYNCAFPEAVELSSFNLILKEIFQKKGLTLKVPEKLLKIFGRVNEYLSNLTGISSVFDRDKAIDITQDFWTCDISKLQKETGWKPYKSFKERVIETANWYKEKNWI